MIQLNDNNIILDSSDKISQIDSTDFNFNRRNYNKSNYALKIDFMNNFKYSIKCIKKLQKLVDNGIDFSSNYNGLNVKFIISNYSNDVIDALKSLYIRNLKDKYTFIYDKTFHTLDLLWKKTNPCNFCNNTCIASRNHWTNHTENGCCYSFEYCNSPFEFIKNIQLCKYLGSNKQCLTQNISCKFFVCDYLKKNNIFNIHMKDFLLVQAFFNHKQLLVLKYNFFRSKEEIINKLLEVNHFPFLFYYSKNMYRIK